MSRKLLYILLLLPYMCSAAETEKLIKDTSPTGMFSGLSSWFFSTFGIVALIVILGLLLKRSRFAVRRSSDLVLESQLALGPKERLFTVRVRGRTILIGATPQHISYLCDLPPRQTDADSSEFGQELKQKLEERAADEKEQ